MPTATTFFGRTITNLGPLTTTYTAPTSCATATNNIYFGPSLFPSVEWFRPTCVPGNYSDCIPSGGAVDKLSREYINTVDQRYIPYFSPGLACPDGWTTVGAINMAQGSEGSSGIFTEHPYNIKNTPENDHVLRWMMLSQFWLELLEDSETLAYCCPSGFESSDNDFNWHRKGDCYSMLGPLEAFNYSTVCSLSRSGLLDIATVTLQDVTTSFWSMNNRTWEPKTEYATITSTITEMDMEIAVVVVTNVPAVALVYKDSDKKSEATQPISMRGMMPVVMLIVGILAGAGLFAPW
ncbi:hypothetical protein NM208_g2023 [Fusarium decemcellulare]|uniref:Uncharacterized protein n=1 Tax=Fusarium decemcellulare TaxID=57161 RepID=A0ACC1SU13_9HYPO|nr:hypothetical protein NM208_g2023 [Fusarium decemcellulare]